MRLCRGGGATGELGRRGSNPSRLQSWGARGWVGGRGSIPLMSIREQKGSWRSRDTTKR